MRITPLDVRKQEFRRVVRGLDPEEVYAFMATIADEYEAVLTDNKQLREKVLDLDDKVTEYRNMEKTLRDTLLTAERVMAEARDNARKESELILKDAHLNADQHTASISARVEALRTQLRELRAHRDAFLVRLRTLAESQMHLVQNYQHDFEADDQRVLEIASRERDEGAPDVSVPTAPRTGTVPSSDPRPRTDESDHWRDYAVTTSEGREEPSRQAEAESPRPEPASEPTATEVPTSIPPAPILTGVDDTTRVESDPVRAETVPVPVHRGGVEDLAQVVAAVTAAAVEPTIESRPEPIPEPRPEPLYEPLHETTAPAASGGQPSQSVAPSPSPDQPVHPSAEPFPFAPDPTGGIYESQEVGPPDVDAAPWGQHASAASVGDAEEHAASASGWSLSRFTKGLGRF